MNDNEDNTLRRFEHLEPMPIDDADYAKEFPLLEPHVPSTCSKCDRQYTHEEFLALPVKEGEGGTWYYASSNVELALRDCKCGERLGRRALT